MPEEETARTVGDAPGGYREVMRMAWPLVVSTGSFTVMMFCDRMFLSWYSATAIQAALPAGILAFTLTCGFMALAAYATTFVAQYYGAGDYPACSRSTGQGVLFSLLSWPVLLLLIPAGCWVLRVSGHAPAVLEAETAYLTILMWGSVATPLSAAISSFFTGRGKTRVTMTANVIGNALNIVLDYALIFGKWGFPEMGIRGAAWATVISGFIAPVILFGIFFSRANDTLFQTRRSLRYDHRLFWRMVRFGLPSGIHLALDIASFTLFVLLTGRISETALAASNMSLSINNVAFMPLIGLGIGASTLVGQYQGRKQPWFSEKVAWTAFKMGIAYMIVVGVTFVVWPEMYFSLFAGRGGESFPLEEVLPVGRVLLLIMAVWGLTDVGNLIIGMALKGAGDTRFVMYYSVTMAWCVLAAGQFVIVEVLHAGIVVSWLWTAFYIGVLALGYIWRFRSGRWKSIDLLGRHAPVEPARPAAEALLVRD